MRGLAVACATLGMILPAGASAEPVPGGGPRYGLVTQSPQGPTADIEVKSGNGYEIDWRILSEEDAGVRVSKDSPGSGGPDVEASYSVNNSRTTMGGTWAKFGSLGLVDVKLRVKRERRVPVAYCKGKPEVIRSGTFVGTIRFEGENGYTKFAATRVPGKITYTPRQFCRYAGLRPERRSASSDEEARGPRFSAAAGQEMAGVHFTAEVTDDPFGPGVFFDATRTERSHGMSVIRGVRVDGPASSFVVDPALNAATITPPAPFSGSASFQRIDDFASRWQGSLMVTFPGLPDFPLTGRDFFWSLARNAD